jgi:hypothetical protein
VKSAKATEHSVVIPPTGSRRFSGFEALQALGVRLVRHPFLPQTNCNIRRPLCLVPRRTPMNTADSSHRRPKRVLSVPSIEHWRARVILGASAETSALSCCACAYTSTRHPFCRVSPHERLAFELCFHTWLSYCCLSARCHRMEHPSRTSLPGIGLV